jgi:hypothetical protein
LEGIMYTIGKIATLAGVVSFPVKQAFQK